jgi:hypothetical protein
MLRFQKSLQNLFLTLYGHRIHCQQRELPTFLKRYKQWASHAHCGAAGPVSKTRRRNRRSLSVGSVLNCSDLHPNHLAVNLIRLHDNKRLRRFLPTDLPDRFQWTFLRCNFSLKLVACTSCSLLTHEALNLFIWRCATEHSSSCL